MERVFGFDIGTTSIGFAVVDHDPTEGAGQIHRLGVRIFPEARDPDGTPLNQQRRAKRMMRRQLRRRRVRRRALNELLQEAGLLPPFDRCKDSKWSKLMKASPYELHHVLRDPAFVSTIREAIFFQRPVFWRKNTLGKCPFVPGAALCPRGSWLSQQRRMLEKLNNLAIAGGNRRPLDATERAAILAKLQTQGSMTWPGVRAALRPLFAARGEKGAEKSLKFNLELDEDSKLPGNVMEAKLADIFGNDWADHPYKQAIRDAAYPAAMEA